MNKKPSVDRRVVRTKLAIRNALVTLIKENGFENDSLAVKLLAAKNDFKKGNPLFLAAFARKWAHRLKTLEKDGLDVATYPFARQTPLADHKTLNYLYYHQAGHWAKQQNADEALILNPDNSVSETNTCNILVILDRKVILPASNERDLRDVPDEARSSIEFHFVDGMDEVLELALLGGPKRNAARD